MTSNLRRSPSRWTTLASATAMAWPTFAAEQALRSWAASRRARAAETARALAPAAAAAPAPAQVGGALRPS